MSKALVIGGGAAGMFAAATAARNGHEVLLYEKNERLGKKLFITGKGRCNLTNDCGRDTFLASVMRNPRFLYSSFSRCGTGEVIRFFEELGVKTRTERGGRVFPASGRSSDVIRALERELLRLGVKVYLNAEVQRIYGEAGKFQSLVLKDGRKVAGDACIIATGGLSYPSTGSTGDGYGFAESIGHTIQATSPALVPMETKETWAPGLMGLSLRNVEILVRDGKKELYRDFGEMLFTHYGVSGPLILSASSQVAERLAEKPLLLEIDLKPALDEEQLHRRVLRDFEENRNRQFKNSLGKLFPAKLIPVMTALSGIGPDKKVNAISKGERRQFVHLIKHFTVTLTGIRGYDEAVITRGGVKTGEIDPGAMESKLMKGVFFAGEVLDVDALTGGFNLQAAWSTAFAAGSAV